VDISGHVPSALSSAGAPFSPFCVVFLGTLFVLSCSFFFKSRFFLASLGMVEKCVRSRPRSSSVLRWNNEGQKTGPRVRRGDFRGGDSRRKLTCRNCFVEYCDPLPVQARVLSLEWAGGACGERFGLEMKIYSRTAATRPVYGSRKDHILPARQRGLRPTATDLLAANGFARNTRLPVF
jgi:hypothetical protein